MATIESLYTGDGSTVLFSFTFPYLEESHIQVSLNGSNTTAYTLANATTVEFNTAPAVGVAIRLYRDSDTDTPEATFFPGSAIRAADLNDNFLQSLYLNQETRQLAQEAALGGIPDGAVTSSKILNGTILNEDINASAGIDASKLSFTQAGFGATARTVGSKLKDVVSVKDFGAVGDGVADDTAAIQAAITSLGETKGGTVYFPAGTYLTTSNIEIKSKATLLGDGRQSLIKSVSMVNLSATPVAEGGQTQFYAINKSGFNFINLGFDTSGITVFTTATRTLYFKDSSNFKVQGCYFNCSGCATASLGCFDYWILDNDIDYNSTDSIAHHDGVIDQWWGSHDFVIRGNRIYGNGIALWPILVTGTNSLGTAGTPMYNFVISENYIKDCKNPAIFTMGRAGRCSQFQIFNNTIENVTEKEGIAITESDSFVVNGNIIKNTYWSSIRAYDEAGTATEYSANNGVIADNVCIDANQAENASSYEGSTITIAGLSRNIALSGNVVQGTKHRYAIACVQSPQDISVSNGVYTPGVNGTVFGSSTLNATNIYPGGTSYIANAAVAFGGDSPTNMRSARYRRYDKHYECEGATRINVTTAATNLVRITLDSPTATTFASGLDVIGFAANSTADITGIISAFGDKVYLDFISRGAGLETLSWSFKYTLP
jgi:hypothetical protein